MILSVHRRRDGFSSDGNTAADRMVGGSFFGMCGCQATNHLYFSTLYRGMKGSIQKLPHRLQKTCGENMDGAGSKQSKGLAAHLVVKIQLQKRGSDSKEDNRNEIHQCHRNRKMIQECFLLCRSGQRVTCKREQPI